VKFTTDRPLADPEKAARKLIEIANATEVVQEGRIYIELINGPFAAGTHTKKSNLRPATGGNRLPVLAK
jgi:hypothetical protein